MSGQGLSASPRRFPRLITDGPLSVRVSAVGSVMEVQNISLGGANTTCTLPLDPGTRHTFEFALRGVGTIHLEARIVYCQAREDGRTYSIGWAWEPDAVTEENSRALIDYLTDVANVGV